MMGRELLLTVESAGEVAGLTRSPAYRAAERGDIPTVLINGRTYVPRMRLDRDLLHRDPADVDADVADLLRRPLLSVSDVVPVLGLCRSAVYRAVNSGDLPSVCVAGRTRIRTADLCELLGVTDADLKRVQPEAS